MIKKALCLTALLMAAAGMISAPANADPVVKYLEGKEILTAAEADALRSEIAEEQKKKASLLTLGNKLKIDGRIYAGFLDGENKKATFEIPDGALRFTWGVADNVDVVTRWRYGSAKSESLDQMYVRFKKLLPFDKTSHLSVGKFKMDVGEEHNTDNRVGNWVGLVSNSASAMVATDWGAALSGSFVPGKAGYVLTLSNGNNGDVTDNNYEKAYSAKIHWRPVKPLYVSGSYYHSGNMDNANAAMSIAGNKKMLTGVTDWRRSVWKAVVRWEPNKTARLGAAYGEFRDEAVAPAGIGDVEGGFYYLEGMYNLTPEFYVAGRYSAVELEKAAVASLNSLSSCNAYERYSLGTGYRVNKNVTLKAEYNWNYGKTKGTADKTDNSFMLGAAVVF